MAPSGYSGTPLVKKLGIKPGHRVIVVQAPVPYTDLVADFPSSAEIVTARVRSADIAHLFATRYADLEKRVKMLRPKIFPDGMLWVSWPKKASGVVTDITEDIVRKVAFANRLVDVKVCAVDEVWSGLKLVVPKKDR